MAKVIVVFGLSGVGKSWIISRYAAGANVAHVQASQLMRDAKAAQLRNTVTSEDLRRGPVLDNQSLLVNAFTKVLSAETRPIIFDGHCLVDAGDQIIEIPTAVIRQLKPSAIVLVSAPAEHIVLRRESDTSRQRPTRTAYALTAQQDRCVALCTDYAQEINVSFVQVDAGDERGFARAIGQMLHA
jgi:adenylate kinase